MIFSKPTSYAIRALVFLAQHYQQGSVFVSEIAKAEQLPAPFLSKLIRELSAAGVVTSLRGPGGGISLSHPPNQVSLYDVFMLYDGLTLSNECLLGHAICSDETACCVHRLWKPTKTEIERFLKGTSIADLLEMRQEQRDILLPRH
ncbi:Rrf2 family transcriptional regulator [bacterium]|nr:Rrf2 family transcriptional regulator [bacterium]